MYMLLVMGHQKVMQVLLRVLNKMDTGAKVSTGGFVSIPQSLARNTSTNNTNIVFENGSILATQRGDIDLRTVADADIDTRAKTSVWGLAGVGASGKAYSTLNSAENVTIGTGSTVRANGYLRAYAGLNPLPSSIDVLSKTDVYNKTLIPVTTGKGGDCECNPQRNVNSG